MQVSVEGFGRPLRNPVRVAGAQAETNQRKSSGVNHVKTACGNYRTGYYGWRDGGAPALRGFSSRGLQPKSGQICALRQRGRDRRRIAARRGIQAQTSSSAWSRTILLPGAYGSAKMARWRGRLAEPVLIECSTLTVGWVKELAAAAAQQGCELLDAPVTGTKPHAASGELSFLIGGSASGARHRPAGSLCAGTRIHSSRPDRQRRADEAHQQFHVRRAGCLARGSRIYDRRRRPGLCRRRFPFLLTVLRAAD